jgi:hypothetical protein
VEQLLYNTVWQVVTSSSFICNIDITDCRKSDGIRKDLREIGWGSVDWIQLLRIGTGGGLL